MLARRGYRVLWRSHTDRRLGGDRRPTSRSRSGPDGRLRVDARTGLQRLAGQRSMSPCVRWRSRSSAPSPPVAGASGGRRPRLAGGCRRRRDRARTTQIVNDYLPATAVLASVCVCVPRTDVASVALGPPARRSRHRRDARHGLVEFPAAAVSGGALGRRTGHLIIGDGGAADLRDDGVVVGPAGLGPSAAAHHPVCSS
jgi:hypothetical protein